MATLLYLSLYFSQVVFMLQNGTQHRCWMRAEQMSWDQRGRVRTRRDSACVCPFISWGLCQGFKVCEIDNGCSFICLFSLTKINSWRKVSCIFNSKWNECIRVWQNRSSFAGGVKHLHVWNSFSTTDTAFKATHNTAMETFNRDYLFIFFQSCMSSLSSENTVVFWSKCLMS